MCQFLVNSCVEAPTQITRVFVVRKIWWDKIDLGNSLVQNICESYIIKVTLTQISTARMSLGQQELIKPTRGHECKVVIGATGVLINSP